MTLPGAFAGLRPSRWLVAIALSVAMVAGSLVLQPLDEAAAAPNTYVRMPDGVEIALNVRMPKGYVKGRRYPTLFEMSGYDGGSADDRTLAKDYGIPGLPQDDSRQLSRRFTEYVTIHASIRGTGCSGGEFDLFSPVHARDGRYIIDRWIARQPWSNGDVALMGHSYGGITGFMVAANRPKHLRVATLSGLIDDLYRGITYPGGVSNYGFPLLWTGAIRPVYDVGGGTAEGVLDGERPDDQPGRRESCARNQTTKSRAVTNDPLIQGLSDTDNMWWRARSLIGYANKIEVPLHITGAYQDEQTGPRFANLFQRIHRVPKRLLMANGNHDTQNPEYTGPAVYKDRKSWVDHWMGVKRHAPFGALHEDRTSVRALLEMHRDSGGVLRTNGRIDDATFPLSTTRWTSWFLRADGGLTPSQPGAAEGADRYLSGGGRQSWLYQAGPRAGAPFTTEDGPDQLVYRSAKAISNRAVVGPITATLYLQSSAPDTEMFVQLFDEAPDGSRTYLQRGMLRASHRAMDRSRSDYDGDVLYRPWRPHTNTTPITPGATYAYVVEVFPVGHVFRKGHRIGVRISAPPRTDSYYAYVPKVAPSVNTLLHDAAHPSRILLPTVPLAGSGLGPEIPCGGQEAVRCIP